MTPEQLAALQKVGYDSPQVQRAAQPVNNPSDDSVIQGYMQDLGVSQGDVDQYGAAMQKKQEDARLERLRKSLDASVTNNLTTNAVVTATDIVAGVGTAARDMARHTFNGMITALDSIENYAATKGIGTGDILNANDKWEDPEGQKAVKALGTEGQIARAAYNFIAPLSAGLATGGGLAAGATVDTLYNFLAVDPNEKKLVDHLKGTQFEDMPIVADLMTKPYDTEMDGRLKNAMTAAGISTGIGLLAHGVMAASAAYKARRATNLTIDAGEVAGTVMPKAVPETPAVPRGTEAPPAVVPNAAPAVDAAKLAAEEQGLKQFEDGLAKVQWFESGIKTADNGTPKIPLQDSATVNNVAPAMAEVPRDILYTPMTDAELQAAAKAASEDSKIIERLTNWKQGDPTPNAVETLVLKSLHANATEQFLNHVKTMGNSPEDLLMFQRLIDNFQTMSDVSKGAASAKGAAFRAEQLGPILEGVDQKTWLQNLGNEGRANLIRKMAEKSGGLDGLAEMADKMKAIADMPDGMFTRRMGEVIEKSKTMRMTEAIAQVATNGMLSSPGTSLKAMTTNALGATKIAIDSYAQALTPGAVLTIKEANARMAGMFSAMTEAHGVALKAFSEPLGAKNIKLDWVNDAPVSFDEHMMRSGMSWIEKGADILTVGKAPVRALIATDAYWQHIIREGDIQARLMRKAIEQNVKPSELQTFLKARYENLPMDVSIAADNLAAKTTLAKELSPYIKNMYDKATDVVEQGVTAAFGSNVMNTAEDYMPLAKVVVPFVKTNLNLIEQVVENSPLAIFSPNIRAAIKSTDPIIKQQAVAQIATSSAALGALAYMANLGLVKGMAAPNDRFFKSKETPVETSIKVGNKWVSVKDQPLLAPLVNMADFVNKAAGHLNDEQRAELVTTFKMVVAETLSPDTLTESVSGIFNAVAGDTEAGNQWLTSLPTRFVPMGAAIKDVAQLNDKYSRQTKVGDLANLQEFSQTVINKYKAMIPGMSKELPPIMNRYGEPLELPAGIGPAAVSPIAITDGKDMPHKQAIEELQKYYSLHSDVLDAPALDLRPAPKSIDAVYTFEGAIAPKAVPIGHRYKFKPDEYAMYQSLYGGIDPNTGKALEGGTLRENELDVLKKYKVLGTRSVDITPQVYKAVTSELAGLELVFKKRADTLIRGYGSVEKNMNEQWGNIQKFNQIKGL